MNKIRNIIVALGVIAMMIGSGFAMDTNPPTEPVKTTVEIKVEDDVQSSLVGYGYKDLFGNCVHQGTLESLSNCLPSNTGDICIDTSNRDLYFMSRETEHDDWVCGLPLRKPKAN